MEHFGKARTNTEYERLALTNEINLSDGHARHPATEKQRAILRDSLILFDRALRTKQDDAEAVFLSTFFDCAKQSALSSGSEVFLSYSSSCSIKMVAQYCRTNRLSVSLIEPCFDNIRHILVSEGVQVSPLREADISKIASFDADIRTESVIWIVQPNNPTGYTLSRAQFRSLLEFAATTNKLLVIDFCFRFFCDELLAWDQYSLLKESGAEYITIEDTGKTWSLCDTKAGITVTSKTPAATIYRLHDELLLNVSPFHLLLLNAFIRNSIEDGLLDTVRAEIEVNRGIVERILSRTSTRRATEYFQNVPMELLELLNGQKSMDLWRSLRTQGIHILPAHNYYWSAPEQWHSVFRIPLSRPRALLEAAMPIIERAIILGSARPLA